MGDRVCGRAISGGLFDQACGLAGSGCLGRARAGVGGCHGGLALGYLGPVFSRVERVPAEAEAAEDLDAGHDEADRRGGHQDPVDRREAGDVGRAHQR
jgi:hypothetical protein